jgi:Zn-finger nucleic acid-binding protein
MKKTIFESILVDCCTNCWGFWLDGGEFERALKGEAFNVEATFALAKMEKLDEKEVRNASHKCQRCPDGEIVPYKRSGIKLDKCNQCGSIFFDKGELDALFLAEKPGFLSRVSAYLRSLSS